MTTHNTREIEQNLNPATKAMLEAVMWQIKGDMHNLVGQYNPPFIDKVERHMTEFLLALQQDAHQELQKAQHNVFKILYEFRAEEERVQEWISKGGIDYIDNKARLDIIEKILKRLTQSELDNPTV